MLLRYRLTIGVLGLLVVGLALSLVAVLLRSQADGTRSNRPDGVPDHAERAVVSDHVDGDTLRLRGSSSSVLLAPDEETTVRMLEIDTPESVAPGSPVECHAERSSAALAGMLPLGSRVWVAADVELLDPYDRVLLYVWTDKGTFVNLEMVESGHARAVLYEPNDEYIDLMRRAERRARSADLGLWGDCDYFGQPRGLVGPTTEPPPTAEPPPTLETQPPSAGSGTDPRFDTCAEADAAGYGDYRRGRDPEYAWYDDADGDGRVCER